MSTKADITISKILHAAEELFLNRNYAEVKVDQIAELSGVTKGGLYHHFSSKEELYLEMMRRDLDEKERLFSHAINVEENTRTRLNRLTQAFFNLPHHKQNLIRLVRRDINIFQEPQRGQLVARYQAALPDLVQTVIEKGLERGEMKSGDPRILAWHFVAMVEVAMSDYANSILGDTQAKLNHVLDLFFGGTRQAHAHLGGTQWAQESLQNG